MSSQANPIPMQFSRLAVTVGTRVVGQSWLGRRVGVPTRGSTSQGLLLISANRRRLYDHHAKSSY